MSQTASSRRRNVFVVVFAIALIAVVAFALWRLSGGEAKPTASAPTVTPSSAATTATPTPTPSRTPSPTATPPCEGPDTQFNVEGVEQDSLLPDCGTAAVTAAEQQKNGLGLACGGSFPVILYKTTTSDAKTSICGRDSSGESFRLVTRPRGGEVIDLPGSYDPQRDAFVSESGGTEYAVLAYNGSLVVTKGGKSTTQDSDDDWISLDNESDFD